MHKFEKLSNVLLLLLLIGLVALPVSAKSILDETNRGPITVPDNPQRIVALTPWVVEILFDLGITPAGRPSSASYPDAALKVPAHGTSYRLNYERIISLRPDLIIGNENLHGAYINDLEKLAAPVLLYDIDSYDAVIEKTRILGEITGKTQRAEELVEIIENRTKNILAKLPETKPTAVVLVGSSEAFSVAKSNSYVGDILELLGAENIGDAGPEHRPGFTKLSLEYIAKADPDVIFAVKPVMGPSDTSSALEGYDRNPLWFSLSAVKNGQVYELDSQFFMNPGPRVIYALDEMAQALYPEVFVGE